MRLSKMDNTKELAILIILKSNVDILGVNRLVINIGVK